MLKVMCLVWFPDFTMLKMVCVFKKHNNKKQKQKQKQKNDVLRTSATASKRLRIGPKGCIILQLFKTSRAQTI